MLKRYVLRCERNWVLESESDKEEDWLVVAALGDVLEKDLIDLVCFSGIFVFSNGKQNAKSTSIFWCLLRWAHSSRSFGAWLFFDITICQQHFNWYKHWISSNGQRFENSQFNIWRWRINLWSETLQFLPYSPLFRASIWPVCINIRNVLTDSESPAQDMKNWIPPSVEHRLARTYICWRSARSSRTPPIVKYSPASVVMKVVQVMKFSTNARKQAYTEAVLTQAMKCAQNYTSHLANFTLSCSVSHYDLVENAY